MKNTKVRGKLRFLVYKSGDYYTGICFELGIVEENKDVNKLLYRLKNGSEAIVKAVIENNLDESHLNKRVALKYYLIWYFGWIVNFKGGYGLRESKLVDNFRNREQLAPSCI